MGSEIILRLPGRAVDLTSSVFVDTGVLVAWVWQPDMLHREAAMTVAQLAGLARQGTLECVTSTLALSEVWDVLVRRPYAQDHGLGTWRALGKRGQGEAFATYAKSVGNSVRHIVATPWLTVVPFVACGLLQSLDVAQTERLRTNDACHIAAARESGCGTFITTDSGLQSVQDPLVITLLPTVVPDEAVP